jgi:kynurenine formamidase
MIDALHLWVPRGPDEAITRDALEAACRAAEVTPRAREALLVGTGWDSHWYEPDYVTNPPYFTAAAIDWVLEHDFSLLGGDTPRYDSPSNPQNFFPKFFSHDILLLAPLINLHKIQKPRGKLIALPLKIQKACASPVRALWIEP